MENNDQKYNSLQLFYFYILILYVKFLAENYGLRNFLFVLGLQQTDE